MNAFIPNGTNQISWMAASLQLWPVYSLVVCICWCPLCRLVIGDHKTWLTGINALKQVLTSIRLYTLFLSLIKNLFMAAKFQKGPITILLRCHETAHLKRRQSVSRDFIPRFLTYNIERFGVFRRIENWNSFNFFYIFDGRIAKSFFITYLIQCENKNMH